jgi:hypothetical protein
MVGVWVLCLAGLRGTGLWSGYCIGLCRPWGHGPVEIIAADLGAWPAEQRSCRAVQALRAWLAKQRCAGLGAQPSEMELLQGCAGLEGRGLAEMVNVCDSLALRAPPTEILQFWEWEFGVAQPWQGKGAEPMGHGLACSARYSFSIWRCGEASHELRVYSADVSALPGVLPWSGRSPASYQGRPWITEVRSSVAVFQSPS